MATEAAVTIQKPKEQKVAVGEGKKVKPFGDSYFKGTFTAWQYRRGVITTEDKHDTLFTSKMFGIDLEGTLRDRPDYWGRLAGLHSDLSLNMPAGFSIDVKGFRVVINFGPLRSFPDNGKKIKLSEIEDDKGELRKATNSQAQWIVKEFEAAAERHGLYLVLRNEQGPVGWLRKTLRHSKSGK